MKENNIKPNIIFILADDMGYGDISLINGGLSSTPTIDWIMSKGICFTQNYAGSCVCNPSRASLLTGRYPHRTGSIDTLEWHGLDRLALREVTLAQKLKEVGYITGLIGKWHLGAFDRRYHPLNRGFDEAICFCGGMHDYYKWRIEYGFNVKKADGRYLTDVWTDEAIQFIKRHKNEKFFLHLTYNAPHTPLQVPEEEIKPFREKGKFTEAVCIIYGMIHRMDSGIAKILETLKDLGIEENTMLIFTSDNGPQFSGKGENSTVRFNCQFNGAKGSVYEGGIRVPLILYWPAVVDSHREITETVHFCDWFPTLLEITGGKIPDNIKIDGVSILPLIYGQKCSLPEKRFWQWTRYKPYVYSNAAVRYKDWKLIRPVIPGTLKASTVEPWLYISMYEPEKLLNRTPLPYEIPLCDISNPPAPELYNITEDPLERTNLAGKYPDITSFLMEELNIWFEDVEKDRASIND